MDVGLPTYETAVSKDPWALVAPYISSSDLPSCARVSQQWYTLANPLIWGNPAAHFSKEHDAVYIALVRLKRTLAWARLSTRRLTHTLHLPPAHPELYDGPRPDWLRTMLERLPHLQSLVVAGLPFFDHAALMEFSTGRAIDSQRQYHLKLLDASGCFNATAKGLAGVLQRLPGLIYLDLSGTAAAKSELVYQALSTLSHLETLKLRGVGLQDADAAVLLRVIARRVHSLDLRDNALTDSTVSTLVKQCCLKTSEIIEIIRRNIATMTGEWPLLDMETALELSSPVLNTERRDEYLRRMLTTGFVVSTETEHWANTGTSHLWIAGNKITQQGVMKLLSIENLLSLDVGHLHASSKASTVRMESPQTLRSQSSSLRYLRIDHKTFTQPAETPQTDQSSMSGAQLTKQRSPPPLYELDTTQETVHELPTAEIYELPAYDAPPVELDGNPISNDPPAYKKDIIPPNPLGHPALESHSQSHPHPNPPADRNHLPIPPLPRHHTRTYSNVTSNYATHLNLLKSTATTRNLHPYLFPHLMTLTLTDVPSHIATTSPSRIPPSSPSSTPLPTALTTLLNSLALEQHWSHARASVDYALPPGRQREDAQRRRAEALFGLKKLILEVHDTSNNITSDTSELKGKAVGEDKGKGMSSVEDPDCEHLWSAARDDFSFFHEDTEECGLPLRGESTSTPSAPEEKIAVVSEEANDSSRTELPAAVRLPVRVRDQMKQKGQFGSSLMIDVVAEVGKFRREARRSWLEGGMGGAEQRGSISEYWDGKVVVVRVK